MGYQLIQTIEVGSGGAASIEFTGIPQDGVDLVIKVSDRTSESGTDSSVVVRVNSTGSSGTTLRGNGASAISGNSFFNTATGNTATANTFSNSEYFFSNYSSNVAKSFSGETVTENNGTTSRQTISAGSSATTDGISAIEFSISGGANFLEYSTASLYKITAD
jgi:hypothetical protein